MGHVEVAHVSHALPDGRVLLADASFRVGEGVTAALVGPNGAGKTTLLRLICGDLPVQTGTVGRSGGLGVMRQFIGGFRGVVPPDEQGIGGFRGVVPPDEQGIGGFRGVVPPGGQGIGGYGGVVPPDKQGIGGYGGVVPPDKQGIGGFRGVVPPDEQGIGSGTQDEATVRDLLISTAPPRVQAAGSQLDSAELAMMESSDEPVAMAYAAALTDWGDAGGYRAEVLWDACCTAALGVPYERCRWRALSTLSGGEQKRLVLEALLRGPDEVLLLDEPDNYLDVPGKRWLEEQLAATPKTVLLVSHDRELLANAAERIITVESGGTWVHGGGFASYAQARRDRIGRLEELRRRWDEEHARLKAMVAALRQKASYNSDMASRLHAAETRLRKFEEAGPPEVAPREQNVRMRLRGGRTGKRAIVCAQLELTGLMMPFDYEIWYGERVAVLGSNGSGKTQFLRLLAGDDVPHSGTARLGARVVAGRFTQTHARPDLAGRSPVEILATEHALQMNEAMSALARYELTDCARQPFGTLSGGQQARLQVLLLELAGSTLLLLDEPTDNLDLASAEALQQGLESYQGTVVAVTHDRWFARSFDRFLVFGADASVYEADEPVWSEARVTRSR